MPKRKRNHTVWLEPSTEDFASELNEAGAALPREYPSKRLNREGDILRHIVGDRQIWPAADRIAAWMHETALRLFPDSPYAKAHKD